MMPIFTSTNQNSEVDFPVLKLRHLFREVLCHSWIQAGVAKVLIIRQFKVQPCGINTQGCTLNCLIISALLSVLVYYSGHSVRFINRNRVLRRSVAQQICNKLAAPDVTYIIVTDLKGY
jgi:hypothetical protein